jgi:hypothetical protein
MFSRYGGDGLTHLMAAVWPTKTARGIRAPVPSTPAVAAAEAGRGQAVV